MCVKKVITIKHQQFIGIQPKLIYSIHIDEIHKKVKDLTNYKLIFSAHGLPEKNIKKAIHISGGLSDESY